MKDLVGHVRESTGIGLESKKKVPPILGFQFHVLYGLGFYGAVVLLTTLKSPELDPEVGSFLNDVLMA